MRRWLGATLQCTHRPCQVGWRSQRCGACRSAAQGGSVCMGCPKHQQRMRTRAQLLDVGGTSAGGAWQGHPRPTLVPAQRAAAAAALDARAAQGQACTVDAVKRARTRAHKWRRGSSMRVRRCAGAVAARCLVADCGAGGSPRAEAWSPCVRIHAGLRGLCHLMWALGIVNLCGAGQGRRRFKLRYRQVARSPARYGACRLCRGMHALGEELGQDVHIPAMAISDGALSGHDGDTRHPAHCFCSFTSCTSLPVFLDACTTLQARLCRDCPPAQCPARPRGALCQFHLARSLTEGEAGAQRGRWACTRCLVSSRPRQALWACPACFTRARGLLHAAEQSPGVPGRGRKADGKGLPLAACRFPGPPRHSPCRPAAAPPLCRQARGCRMRWAAAARRRCRGSGPVESDPRQPSHLASTLLPPSHQAPAPVPMAAEHVPASASVAGGGDAGDAPNGGHHLLRHVLSPSQCSDALHHFGTTDSKAAARMVTRMSQRELRDMFCKVRGCWRGCGESAVPPRRYAVRRTRAGRSQISGTRSPRALRCWCP